MCFCYIVFTVTNSPARFDFIHDTLTHIENMRGADACYLTRLEQTGLMATVQNCHSLRLNTEMFGTGTMFVVVSGGSFG